MALPDPTPAPRARGPRRLSDAGRLLVADHFPLALAEASPFAEASPHLADEMRSAACLALVEAAGKYDASRNVYFWRYARDIIRWRCREVARATRRAPLTRAQLRHRIAAASPGNARLLGVDPTHDDDPAAAIEEAEALTLATAALSPKQRALVEAIVARGRTAAEVAAEMGLGRSAARALVESSLAALASRPTPPAPSEEVAPCSSCVAGPASGSTSPIGRATSCASACKRRAKTAPRSSSTTRRITS